MITIQFREKKDAVLFFQQIQAYNHEDIKNIQVSIVHEPETLVKIIIHKSFESIRSTIIIPVLLQYIVKIVEVKWMKEMINDIYYFSDEEEQQQIISIAKSIIDGDMPDLPYFPELNEVIARKKMIELALREFLTSSVSFSFESFLQFRLKEYRSLLVKYVEAAIDEYKLEQEYQNFVDNLRTFVYKKEPLMETIHLLHDDSFRFFDQNFNEINSEQLQSIIDEHLSYVEDIDTESFVIAPLISIAPRKLYLYTDELDHGLVQSIQNIYLERAVIDKKKSFYKAENSNVRGKNSAT